MWKGKDCSTARAAKADRNANSSSTLAVPVKVEVKVAAEPIKIEVKMIPESPGFLQEAFWFTGFIVFSGLICMTCMSCIERNH
jgi:hypothetical protein